MLLRMYTRFVNENIAFNCSFKCRKGVIMKNEDTLSEKEVITEGKKNVSTSDLVYIGVFAALIAVCSWIQIPAGPVPFTLQTLGVCLAAGLVGLKKGTACVGVYILIGLIGVPVFSNFGAGPGGLLGFSGGYFIGLIFSALAVGAGIKFFGKKIWVYALFMVIGVALCYAFGTAWFMIYSANHSSPVSLAGALSVCVVPFIIPDLVKITIAVLLCSRLSKVIRV